VKIARTKKTSSQFQTF